MKKVIIIGAGPAGITAALELLRRGKNEYDVTVLEESDSIGGISRTVNLDGNRYGYRRSQVLFKRAARK